MKEGVPYVPINFAQAEELAASERGARVHQSLPRRSNSQVQYANAWMTTVVKGVADKANADAQAVCRAEAARRRVREERAAMMELAKKIYTK